MTARRSTGLLLAAITVGCAGPAPTYDLVLRGGTVVDGTGAEPRIADVAVEGDRIVAVEAVALDVYPYTAYSTYSDIMFPPWALEGSAEDFATRVAGPETRRRLQTTPLDPPKGTLQEEMVEIFPRQAGRDGMSIQFREVAGRPELTGRTLAGYAEERGLGSGTEAAVAALIELQVDGGFIGIFHGMDEGDVRRLMNHPLTMFETDGDLVSPGVGFPHPRSYGSFPRILGRYVRDEGVLDLPTAIHKMTGQPAAWYGQSDRGRLTAAFLADITVFDAGLVADRAEYTDPHHYPAGIIHVVVNGEPVLLDGEMTGQLPGRFLDRPTGE